MNGDTDSGQAPDLDEITLLHLPPPDAADRILDERLPDVDTQDEPEPDEDEPWWRQGTGG
ncbi:MULTISPECIES: hypothetical protein [unclassified Kribbella]|uniref:hypothetical protein n=1 Tax=unclassified Kribbella TaxID=2644121 RepID=UPI00307838E4